ncbi:DMT family transporter [Ferribacterium limneticum]|uniref:DMT family transporter n=1 Tax=Ferribacterium limneticum TaxID=76259 RepID=UPI001CFB2F1A|nr:DMT family transporter [Ferribacterium limneticum]UCV29838.1 DMT family transporter [Ferribacterium limneticum]UCV33757.1 DMT family transporter [Ferribacterium limneticum]
MKNLFANPYLLLTLTVLSWSGNMVIGRGVRGDIPPLTFAFWRWVIAFALILPLALPHLKAQWPLLKKGWKPLLVLGLLGVGGYNTFAYIALQDTTATNAALLNSFIPIATIAISWAFLGKHLRRIEGIGVVVSLCGAMTIISRGDPAVLAHLNLNIGDVWMLVAVLDWAIYTVALAWRPAGVHPMLMLGATTVIGLCALAPAYAWEMAQGRFMNVNFGSLSALAYVGIFPSFLGYIFYNKGVAEVGPNKASLFIHLMPVFGTLLSFMFLGEIPFWYHYLGIGLIFTGIWLTTKK